MIVMIRGKREESEENNENEIERKQKGVEGDIWTAREMSKRENKPVER